MKLTTDEMSVIVDALQIAHSKYDIEVQIAMHNYEENAAQLIKQKAKIEQLLNKLGKRWN